MEPMTVKDDHYQDDYSSNPWADMGDYNSPHSQSPATELHSYGFVPSAQHHAMHAESFNRPMHPMYSGSQTPQPLFPAQWPSMLTNPSSQPHHPMPAPPPPIAPVTTFATITSLPPLSTPQPPPQSNSRRTLTDQDRRRMCQYHEDNPTVKQTEIGAMFGVERSTVSKVLRQKDKYLFPEDGSRSPIKKAKGKFPDIERALSNWARNHQRSGLTLNDNMIREKARFFAKTVGSSDCHAKVNSDTWLEKFKQKNHLMGAKPRKSSGSQPDLGLDTSSISQTPNGVSPISPAGGLSSASPISPVRSRDNLKTESPDSFGDFSGLYKHGHSQSATSLASAITDVTAPSSFSPQSPTSSFFSSEINSTSCAPVSAVSAPSNPRTHLPTFPMIDTDNVFSVEAMPGSTQETPNDEYPSRTLSASSELNHASSQPPSNVQSPVQDSPAIMAPPSNSLTASSVNASTVSSPISLPSQDEARRALELVMNFFQNQPSGVVDAQEYIMMGKLMEKLKVRGSLGELPGGMHSIDLSQKEMSRKRSIHSL